MALDEEIRGQTDTVLFRFEAVMGDQCAIPLLGLPLISQKLEEENQRPRSLETSSVVLRPDTVPIIVTAVDNWFGRERAYPLPYIRATFAVM